jgi:hypothetical protein
MMVGKLLHLMMMRVMNGMRSLSLLVRLDLTMHPTVTFVMTTVNLKRTHILVGGMIKQRVLVMALTLITPVTGLVAVAKLNTMMR